MEAISAQQYRAATTGGMPEPEPIDDGLWSVPMPMPGDLLAYSLAVVHVEAGGAVTVLDPGWDSPGSLDRLRAVLRTLGSRLEDVATVVVTHAHPDHVGLAGALREASGARVVMSRREQESVDAGDPDLAVGLADRLVQWRVPAEVADALLDRVADGPARPVPARADALIVDGDDLSLGATSWRFLATPGHTPGHVCVLDDQRRLLFAGDHVLPTLSPGIGLGAGSDTNPLADYLHSLERLAPYDAYDVVPGHGFRFRGLAGRRAELAEHVLTRAREVAVGIEHDPEVSTWDLASRLTWSAGWERLVRTMRLGSALMQVDLYRDFVAAGELAR